MLFFTLTLTIQLLQANKKIQVIASRQPDMVLVCLSKVYRSSVNLNKLHLGNSVG